MGARPLQGHFLVYTQAARPTPSRGRVREEPRGGRGDLWEKLIVGHGERRRHDGGVLIPRGDQCLAHPMEPEHYKDYDKLELSVPWRRGRVNSGTGSIAARRTARAVVLPLRP